MSESLICFSHFVCIFLFLNSSAFIDCINTYANLLDQQQLIVEHSQQLLSKIRQHPATLAAKGCGALGADTLLIIVNQSQKAEFIHWATQHPLAVVADDNSAILPPTN